MQKKPPSKMSSMFSGTQDKCSACNKTVYPLEKVCTSTIFIYFFACCKIVVSIAHDKYTTQTCSKGQVSEAAALGPHLVNI